MVNKIKPRVPRGMRDILPEDMVKRQYVIDVIKDVFEEFGFEPLSTPALELEETLKGKYGEDAERLIYSAYYGLGDEKLSLRYDLSVPLSRVVAMYPNLPKPFKRYHIAPVWRADRPQRGRYREFFQCDADTVGSSSMLGDAETVAVIYTILFRLGFKQFTVYINNRKILNGLGQFAGVPENLLPGLYRSIDKLAKIGPEGVENELLAVGLPGAVFESLRKVARLYLQEKLELSNLVEKLREEKISLTDGGKEVPFPIEVIQVVEEPLAKILRKVQRGSIKPKDVQSKAGDLVWELTPQLRGVYEKTTALIPEKSISKMLSLITTKGNTQEILDSLSGELAAYSEAVEGLNELRQMIQYLGLLGVPDNYYKIDPSMARGLEYYTGPIYETIVEEANVGSITGGGRFDNLIGRFTNRSFPATGTTIGIERIIVVMEKEGMFPKNIGKTATQVLVTAFDESLIGESVKVTRRLRETGIRTQIFFDPISLREQIAYADKKTIPVVVIIGPDEASSGQIMVRDLRRKEQQTLPMEEAILMVKNMLVTDQM